MKRLAKRLGASYLWGVINFALGVAAGSFYGATFVIHAL